MVQQGFRVDVDINQGISLPHIRWYGMSESGWQYLVHSSGVVRVERGQVLLCFSSVEGEGRTENIRKRAFTFAKPGVCECYILGP